GDDAVYLLNGPAAVAFVRTRKGLAIHIVWSVDRSANKGDGFTGFVDKPKQFDAITAGRAETIRDGVPQGQYPARFIRRAKRAGVTIAGSAGTTRTAGRTTGATRTGRRI